MVLRGIFVLSKLTIYFVTPLSKESIMLLSELKVALTNLSC